MRLPKIAETKTVVRTSTTTALNTADTTTAGDTVQTTSRRIVSDASIANPDQDSAGGVRVFANNEKASDGFANHLIAYVCSTIWPTGIVLDWVGGRGGDTTLVWNSKYPPCFSSILHLPLRLRLSHFSSPYYPRLPLLKSGFPAPEMLAVITLFSFALPCCLIARDAGAILTMGEKNIMAKTDGSLQIQIPDPKNPGTSINWHRHYYVVPLEVGSPVALLGYRCCLRVIPFSSSCSSCANPRQSASPGKPKRKKPAKSPTRNTPFSQAKSSPKCSPGSVTKSSSNRAIRRYPRAPPLPLTMHADGVDVHDFHQAYFLPTLAL